MLFSQIRQYVKGILANSFINKSTLDKFGENNNGLTFDGNEFPTNEPLTQSDINQIINSFNINSNEKIERLTADDIQEIISAFNISS